jgi:acyl-[acyl-carrier-protein]-phospholipid O-acyltransferase/long-chain-fatty-acid--[acyl-carrier-protein] ligase
MTKILIQRKFLFIWIKIQKRSIIASKISRATKVYLMIKDYNYLFKSRRFLPLFITQFCSAFNDNVLKNSLIILVTYKLSKTLSVPSGLLILLANGLFILPYILFAGIAGQLADKYENTIIVKLVKFIEIIIAAFAIYGFLNENIILLLTLIFFMGTHSAFFGPIKYSILPEHLKRDELISANGYIEAATFLSILTGTLIGGLYIGASYFVIMIMLVTSIIGFISSLYIPKSKNFNKDLIINKNIFKEILSVIKYAQSRRNVFLCILGISWFWFLGATLLSQVPLLARDVLYADYGVSNLFLAVFSLGVIVGSFLCNKIISNEITSKYLFISAIGISVFGIDLYFACKNYVISCEISSLKNIFTFLSNLKSWRILLDLFCMSAITGIYAVPLYAVMQYYSPASHRARIIAANNVYNSIFMIISFIFISTLLALNFTVQTIILLLSVANIIVAIFILSFTPEVRLIPDPIIKWFGTLLFNWLYKVEIKGIENYKKAGQKVVIVANHNSYLDSALLSIYLPEKPIFAIDSTVSKKWWVRIFLNYTKTHNVDNINAMGVKPLINAIKNGKKIAIFPEGRLSSTGSLMKIYEGPGMIADKADAVLLPIMINGTQYTHFSRLNNLPKRKIFTKIIINILPPIKILPPANIDIRGRRKYIAESLYDIMSEMVFKSSNYEQTIYQSLIDIAKIVGPNKSIYRDMDNTRLNFRKLFKENFIIANYILKSSENTDHIAILLPNYNVFPNVFFAIQALGKIALLINSELEVEDIIENLKNTRTNVIFSSRRYVEAALMNDIIQELEKHFKVVYLEDIVNNLNLSLLLKSSILSYFPQLTYDKLCYKKDPDDLAVLIFEKESFSKPRLAALTHKNILSNIAQVRARMDFKTDDIAFNALPLYNCFSFLSTLMMSLSGIETVLYHTPTHYRIIPEMIYMSDTTIVFSTDIFLNNYAKFAHPYDFSFIRYVFACGENLSNHTRKLWMEVYGIKIYEAYGFVEASCFISFNTPMHNKISTQGRLLPYIDYKIQNIESIKKGGKLFVRGPNTISGYVVPNCQIKKIKDVELGVGWFDTGCIAEIDSDNYMKIFGKLSRFININGENINLDLVENIGKQIDENCEIAAIFSHIKNGIIIFTTSKNINHQSFLNFIKSSTFSINLLPIDFKRLSNMPTLSSGNYDYEYLSKINLEATTT